MRAIDIELDCKTDGFCHCREPVVSEKGTCRLCSGLNPKIEIKKKKRKTKNA